MPSDSSPEHLPRLEDQHRREICRVGRWMYERGYIVAGEGNLSVRLDAERILTTPTCVNKGMMAPEDLVIMDMEGTHLHGDRKISSEAGMHLLFYRMRPDVNAICHGHPAHGHGFRRCRTWPRSSAASRSDRRPRQSSSCSLRHSRHAESLRGPRALRTSLRRATACEPWRHHLRARICSPRFSAWKRRALRKNHPLAAISLASPNCSPHAKSPSLWRRAPSTSSLRLRAAARNCQRHATLGESNADEVTLTRAELDALIDEAVRKDRARR